MVALIALATIGMQVVVGPAAEQFDASVRVGVNKGQRIVVSSDDVLRVEALLTYPQWRGPGNTGWIQFAGVDGSIIVSRDAGIPSPPLSSFYLQGGLINYGQFRGSSRVGIRMSITPVFFTGGFVLPQIPPTDGLLYGYSLSLSEPGKYSIEWMPDPANPLIRLFPTVQYPWYVVANSTYVAAEILVVACRPDLTTVSTPGLEGYGVPDGVVDSQDYFFYLQQYQSGNVAIADMTTTATPGAAGYRVPDGLVTGDDYFYFLSEYAGGC